MRSNRITFAVLSFAVCGLLLAGCNKNKKAKTYQAKVKITKGGKGLKDISVTLAPTDATAEPVAGVTDDNGEVTMSAAAGKYKVVLMKQVTESYMTQGKPKGAGRYTADPTQTKLPFPKAYSDKSTTPKEVEIEPDGENSFSIDL